MPRRAVPVTVRPFTARAHAPTRVSFFAAYASAHPRVIRRAHDPIGQLAVRLDFEDLRARGERTGESTFGRPQ